MANTPIISIIVKPEGVVAGCWSLVAGEEKNDARRWLLVAREEKNVAGRWLLEARGEKNMVDCWLLVAGMSVLANGVFTIPVFDLCPVH